MRASTCECLWRERMQMAHSSEDVSLVCWLVHPAVIVTERIAIAGEVIVMTVFVTKVWEIR